MKLVLLSLLFINTICFSQTIQSQKTFGTGFDETNYNSKVYDNHLYLFVTPETAGLSQDKTVAGFNFYDGWFVKMDINFNAIDQFVFGGNSGDSGIDFVKCDNGDFILLLSSSSDSSGNKSTASFGAIDFWVIRISNSGNIIWQKSIGGNLEELGNKILKISDNRYLISGTSTSLISGNKTVPTNGLFDIWSVFIDGQGNILSQSSYGGSSAEFFGDVYYIDNSNQIVYSVNSSSPPSGNKTTNLTGYKDAWIFTTDTLGNMLNQVSYSTGSNTEVYSFSISSNGSKILVSIDSDVNLGGDKTVPGFGDYDAWVVFLDLNLNELDQKVYGGSGSDGIQNFYNDGLNFILACTSTSPIGGNKTETNFGSGDAWIVCIDANGNILWQKTAGGSGNEKVRTAGKSGSDQYVIVCNSLSGISGNKTVPLYVSGSSDLWLFKLNSTLDVQTIQHEMDLIVAPNPFEDEVTFSWNKNQEKVVLEILDVQGKIMDKRIILNGSAVKWSSENLTSGVYFYQITTNSGSNIGRIVKR
jgi:hypothetical protein